MRQKWSKRLIIAEISRMRKSGGQLNSNHVQKDSVPLYQAACTHFGSWRTAIQSSGLSYDDVRVLKRRCPVWGRDKILAIIKERYWLNLPLNSNYIQTKERRLYGASVKYFGGWPQAIGAAGLEYTKLRRQTQRRWSRAAIVEEISNRHAKGLSIRGGDMETEDRGLYLAARRFFGKGGWVTARLLAGFDPTDPDPRQIWTEQSVCEEINRLSDSGLPLNTGSMQNSPYAYLLGAGSKVFGTWGGAIKAAGLDYSKVRRNRTTGWWTPRRILHCISLLEVRGVRLSHKATQKSNGALLAAAIVHFGSWSQAVEAAGIPYRKHCLIWSSKAYVRRVTRETST